MRLNVASCLPPPSMLTRPSRCPQLACSRSPLKYHPLLPTARCHCPLPAPKEPGPPGRQSHQTRPDSCAAMFNVPHPVTIHRPLQSMPGQLLRLNPATLLVYMCGVPLGLSRLQPTESKLPIQLEAPSASRLLWPSQVLISVILSPVQDKLSHLSPSHSFCQPRPTIAFFAPSLVISFFSPSQPFLQPTALLTSHPCQRHPCSNPFLTDSDVAGPGVVRQLEP